jgi:hypothetical protein
MALKNLKRWKVREKQRVVMGMFSMKIKLSIITYKVVKELMTISKSGKIKFY